MTACTPKALQCHYSITCRMLYVDRSEAFAPDHLYTCSVKLFNLPN